MAASSSRFASMTESEIEELIFEKDAKNTRIMISKAVKLLNIYCKEKQLPPPEDLSIAELDDLLGKFYAEARRKDGDFYAKKTLQSTRYGLQRHFDSTRNVNIITDAAFKHSNIVYQSMLVKLKSVGKAKVTHKKPVHPDDLKAIMTSSALDQSTPRGLQNKVFVDYMLYFANRGRENLREMTKEDLMVKTDPAGVKYVELVFDKLTKTERGEGDNEGGQGGVMYETKYDNCPVASFEKYVSVLNPECSAFWQRPKAVPKGNTWYDNMPLGKNTLYSKTKDICREAGISQYTNHCWRATCVTCLDDAGYEARDIMSVSGHRSEASIRSYSRTSEEKKKKMSDALSNLVSPQREVENQPPTTEMVGNLVVNQPTYAPSTNTITLPPIVQTVPVAEPEREPEPEPELDFTLDFDDSFLLTSSQEEVVLRDVGNTFGICNTASTSSTHHNTFNFYNCNVQLHQ